jgi:hypothetical protein
MRNEQVAEILARLRKEGVTTRTTCRKCGSPYMQIVAIPFNDPAHYVGLACEQGHPDYYRLAGTAESHQAGKIPEV